MRFNLSIQNSNHEFLTYSPEVGRLYLSKLDEKLNQNQIFTVYSKVGLEQLKKENSDFTIKPCNRPNLIFVEEEDDGEISVIDNDESNTLKEISFKIQPSGQFRSNILTDDGKVMSIDTESQTVNLVPSRNLHRSKNLWEIELVENKTTVPLKKSKFVINTISDDENNEVQVTQPDSGKKQPNSNKRKRINETDDDDITRPVQKQIKYDKSDKKSVGKISNQNILEDDDDESEENLQEMTIQEIKDRISEVEEGLSGSYASIKIFEQNVRSFEKSGQTKNLEKEIRRRDEEIQDRDEEIKQLQNLKSELRLRTNKSNQKDKSTTKLGNLRSFVTPINEEEMNIRNQLEIYKKFADSCNKQLEVIDKEKQIDLYTFWHNRYMRNIQTIFVLQEILIEIDSISNQLKSDIESEEHILTTNRRVW